MNWSDFDIWLIQFMEYRINRKSKYGQSGFNLEWSVQKKGSPYC